ncbi:hypothetical protein AAFF_G00065780 [Aldrovandia affinis]|uniref:Uncharacterized protein n=1 Tax=Aldrovandia affinis TaxID=143900 RepID=A0AAD7T4D6_9TELE|nr:hypothetical protein AAFF_G00065780 [Aldrovandia affinis]
MANCTHATSCGERSRWHTWASVALLLCAALVLWWRRMRSRRPGATGSFGTVTEPAWVSAAHSIPDPAGQHSTEQQRKGSTGATDGDPSPPAVGPPIAVIVYENLAGGQGVDSDYAHQSVSTEGEYMEYDPSPADDEIYANYCNRSTEDPTEDPSEYVCVFPGDPPQQELHFSENGATRL